MCYVYVYCIITQCSIFRVYFILSSSPSSSIIIAGVTRLRIVSMKSVGNGMILKNKKSNRIAACKSGTVNPCRNLVFNAWLRFHLISHLRPPLAEITGGLMIMLTWLLSGVSCSVSLFKITSSESLLVIQQFDGMEISRG